MGSPIRFRKTYNILFQIHDFPRSFKLKINLLEKSEVDNITVALMLLISFYMKRYSFLKRRKLFLICKSILQLVRILFTLIQDICDTRNAALVMTTDINASYAGMQFVFRIVSAFKFYLPKEKVKV